MKIRTILPLVEFYDTFLFTSTDSKLCMNFKQNSIKDPIFIWAFVSFIELKFKRSCQKWWGVPFNILPNSCIDHYINLKNFGPSKPFGLEHVNSSASVEGPALCKRGSIKRGNILWIELQKRLHFFN